METPENEYMCSPATRDGVPPLNKMWQITSQAVAYDTPSCSKLLELQKSAIIGYHTHDTSNELQYPKLLAAKVIGKRKKSVIGRNVQPTQQSHKTGN